jgi:hypothetical protein
VRSLFSPTCTTHLQPGPWLAAWWRASVFIPWWNPASQTATWPLRVEFLRRESHGKTWLFRMISSWFRHVWCVKKKPKTMVISQFSHEITWRLQCYSMVGFMVKQVDSNWPMFGQNGTSGPRSWATEGGELIERKHWCFLYQRFLFFYVFSCVF